MSTMYLSIESYLSRENVLKKILIKICKIHKNYLPLSPLKAP